MLNTSALALTSSTKIKISWFSEDISNGEGGLLPLRYHAEILPSTPESEVLTGKRSVNIAK